MTGEEIIELHKILLEWMLKKNKKPEDAIAFLTASWVGQMHLNGYTEEFFDSTLDRMKQSWLKHPLHKKNRKYEETN